MCSRPLGQKERGRPRPPRPTRRNLGPTSSVGGDRSAFEPRIPERGFCHPDLTLMTIAKRVCRSPNSLARSQIVLGCHATIIKCGKAPGDCKHKPPVAFCLAPNVPKAQLHPRELKYPDRPLMPSETYFQTRQEEYQERFCLESAKGLLGPMRKHAGFRSDLQCSMIIGSSCAGSKNSVGMIGCHLSTDLMALIAAKLGRVMKAMFIRGTGTMFLMKMEAYGP
ncbi:hypothetical protein FRB95_005389 [Tulasnella sp. JGI-2019a]|nr:hypothetical protein FRB95_005389 [Tulasnella sp. JGI-2019a]